MHAEMCDHEIVKALCILKELRQMGSRHVVIYASVLLCPAATRTLLVMVRLNPAAFAVALPVRELKQHVSCACCTECASLSLLCAAGKQIMGVQC